MKRLPYPDRVWLFVNKDGPVPEYAPDLGPCWLWTGSTNTSGYGQASDADWNTRRAHRLVYELLVGPIPDGLVTDHLCRVPLCVNPNHLEPVTRAENKRRSVRGGLLQTHCKNGHLRTPENIYRRKDRPTCTQCRTCSRERKQRLRDEQKASA